MVAPGEGIVYRYGELLARYFVVVYLIADYDELERKLRGTILMY